MENVGGIQYTVVADTGQLLKAEQDAVRSVGKIDKSLKGLGGSAKHVDTVSKSIKDLGDEADRSGFKLSKIQTALVGLATVTTASSIAKMADDYRAMSERVLGASESLEEFNLVQARLLESANKTFRPLAEAQELFVATSGNLREYGFSVEEALDITDSLSYGFVRNAASSDKASTAIRNYDAVLSTGKVNANQWLAISSAVDTLAIDMGKTFNMTAREIDDLGFSGRLTAEELNEGLLAAFKANKDGADAMANTIEDAVTAMKNNISVYVGELNKSVGATDVVAKSIIYLSENIETLAKVLAVAGAGALAKYVSQVGLVTIAKMKSSIATQAQLAEELKLAQANVASTQAEVARTAALVAKGAAHTKNTQAIQAHTIAVANLDRAQKAASISTSGFLSILGGPAGIIGLLTIGVTSLMAFSSSTKDADIEINNLNKSVEELVESLKNMNEAQREAALIRLGDEQEQLIKNTSQAYKDLEKTMTDSIVSYGKYSRAVKTNWLVITREIEDGIRKAEASGEDLLPLINKISQEYNIPDSVIKSWITQNGVVADSNQLLSQSAEKIDAVTQAQKNLEGQVENTTAAQRRQMQLDKEAGDSLSKLAESMQSAANSAKDGGSAVKRANRKIQEFRDSGAELDEEMVKAIETNAAYIDSQKKSAKSTNSNIEVIRSLRQEMELAVLHGKDLAIARAENQLDKFATTDEVQAVRDLAGALYDLQEAQKFGATKKEQDRYIEGGVGNLSGGSYDDQVARYERDAELEQQRYDDQLEKLKFAREQQLQTEEEFNDLEYELKRKHDERMGRIEQAKNNVVLKSYEASFGAIATVMNNAYGQQSSAYASMFALAKGFAIAQASISLKTALAHALSDPSAVTLSQKLANWGVVAGLGAEILGGIQSVGMSFGGGRQYGGPVSPEKYYRINETGMPEIYNDRSGNQYMLPTSGGSITPANKIGNQSGITNVTINLIEDPDRGGEVSQSEDDRGSIVDIFVADIRSGGEMSNTLERTFNLTRGGD